MFLQTWRYPGFVIEEDLGVDDRYEDGVCDAYDDECDQLHEVMDAEKN